MWSNSSTADGSSHDAVDRALDKCFNAILDTSPSSEHAAGRWVSSPRAHRAFSLREHVSAGSDEAWAGRRGRGRGFKLRFKSRGAKNPCCRRPPGCSERRTRPTAFTTR